MSYRKAALISDDNSKTLLKIAISDDGDVFLKVTNGEASSETVHLSKGGSTNKQILDDLKDIVDTYNLDMPIGHEAKVDGITYVCTKASDGCHGCAFESSSKKCPEVFCCGDDRADDFDVLFKEKC